jgi:hypothetical protein
MNAAADGVVSTLRTSYTSTGTVQSLQVCVNAANEVYVYYQCTDYQLNNLLITCDSNSEVTDNGS